MPGIQLPSGMSAIQSAGPNDQPENTPRRFVHCSLLDLPVAHRLCEARAKITGWTGHLEIQPRAGSLDRRMYGTPIGHQDTIEAPFALQDVGDERLVLRRVRPIHAVVRRHE